MTKFKKFRRFSKDLRLIVQIRRRQVIHYATRTCLTNKFQSKIYLNSWDLKPWPSDSRTCTFFTRFCISPTNHSTLKDSHWSRGPCNCHWNLTKSAYVHFSNNERFHFQPWASRTTRVKECSLGERKRKRKPNGWTIAWLPVHRGANVCKPRY